MLPDPVADFLEGKSAARIADIYARLPDLPSVQLLQAWCQKALEKAQRSPDDRQAIERWQQTARLLHAHLANRAALGSVIGHDLLFCTCRLLPSECSFVQALFNVRLDDPVFLGRFFSLKPYQFPAILRALDIPLGLLLTENSPFLGAHSKTLLSHYDVAGELLKAATNREASLVKAIIKVFMTELPITAIERALAAALDAPYPHAEMVQALFAAFEAHPLNQRQMVWRYRTASPRSALGGVQEDFAVRARRLSALRAANISNAKVLFCAQNLLHALVHDFSVAPCPENLEVMKRLFERNFFAASQAYVKKIMCEAMLDVFVTRIKQGRVATPEEQDLLLCGLELLNKGAGHPAKPSEQEHLHAAYTQACASLLENVITHKTTPQHKLTQYA